jgi:phosphoribosylformimino-5-aminoimidazole carboxamide ribotide isomerase
MQIIPTIELLNGRCVTLQNGRFDEPMLWHVDAVETAVGFVEAGAEILRVTDFDAMQGEDGNAELIAEIIRKAGVPVQIAGGLRSREQAEAWIDRGAAQVVIGTLAARAPDDVKALAKYFPDMVVLSMDVLGGRLMTHGWTSETALEPAEFLASFSDVPLSSVIITDIDADAEVMDKQLSVISALAGETRHRVVASGLVDSLDDLSRLKYVPNIAGAIVGRALMRKDFTLQEALEVARPEYEETAAFQ